MSSKREKSRKKWQKIFYASVFALCRWQIGTKFFFSSRTRLRVYVRAFQQRCWFFAVTSVTQWGKLEENLPRNSVKGRHEMEFFRGAFYGIFDGVELAYITRLLKFPQKSRSWLKYNRLQCGLWHLWQQKCKNSCGARVRVRARKGNCRYFHFSMNSVFDGCFCASKHSKKTTRRFHQNNLSFSPKQPVVWWERTSFLEAISQP